jgi:hypothetical protein
VATPIANTSSSQDNRDPFANIAVPLKKKEDTGLFGLDTSTGGNSNVEQAGNPRQLFGISYADWGKKYGKIGEFAADIVDIPVFFKNEIYKGVLSGAINDEITTANALGKKPDFDRIASLRKDINSVSLPSSMQRQLDAQDDPVTSGTKTIAGTILNSLASSVGAYKSGSTGVVPGAAAGAALGNVFAEFTAPAGAIAGYQSAASYANEFGSSIIDAMSQKGYDISNPKELAKAWEDKDLMEAAKQKGLERGLTVGAIDFMTAGLASKAGSGAIKLAEKTAAKFGKELTESGAKKVAAAAITGTEAISGSAGEATAQLVSEGKITDWDAVAMEAIAELGSSAPSSAYNYYKAAQINHSVNQENTQKIQSLHTVLEQLPPDDPSIDVINTKIKKLKDENDNRNSILVDKLDNAPVPVTKKILELSNQIDDVEQKLDILKASNDVSDDTIQQKRAIQDLHQELIGERDLLTNELETAKKSEAIITGEAVVPSVLPPKQIETTQKAISAIDDFLGENKKEYTPLLNLEQGGKYSVALTTNNKTVLDSSIEFNKEEKAVQRNLDEQLDTDKITKEEYNNSTNDLYKKIITRGLEDKKSSLIVKPKAEVAIGEQAPKEQISVNQNKQQNEFAPVDFDKNLYQDTKSYTSNGVKYEFNRLNTSGEQNVFSIEKNGNEIGRATLDEKGNFLTNIRIDENYRRMGLGSKLYDYIEQQANIKLKPSPIKQSKAAENLWKKRLIDKSATNNTSGNEARLAMSKQIDDQLLAKENTLIEKQNNDIKKAKDDITLIKSGDKSIIDGYVRKSGYKLVTKEVIANNPKSELLKKNEGNYYKDMGYQIRVGTAQQLALQGAINKANSKAKGSKTTNQYNDAYNAISKLSKGEITTEEAKNIIEKSGLKVPKELEQPIVSQEIKPEITTATTEPAKNPAVTTVTEPTQEKTSATQPATPKEEYVMDTLYTNPREMIAHFAEKLKIEDAAKQLGLIDKSIKTYRNINKVIVDNMFTRAASKIEATGFIGIRKIGNATIIKYNAKDSNGNNVEKEVSLNSAWKSIFGYGEKEIKGFMYDAQNSSNVIAKEVENSLVSMIRNISTTESFEAARRELPGEKRNDSNNIYIISKGLNGMIGDDVKSLLRIHSLIDPEVFIDKIKEAEEFYPKTVEDLTVNELRVYNSLRTMNDFIHEWHYQNDFIDQYTYEKNKGKYFARAYKDIEKRQNDELYDAINKAGAGVDFNIFKQRKEYGEVNLETEDPIYITSKRLATISHNMAVIDFCEKVKNDKSYKSYDKLSDVPEGVRKFYKKLEGLGSSKRFGSLTNKYVPIQIYEQLYGTTFVSDIMNNKIKKGLNVYDRLWIRQWLSKSKTLYSPLTRLANITSGISFGLQGGVGPFTMIKNRAEARKSLANYDEDAQALTKAGLMGVSVATEGNKKSVLAEDAKFKKVRESINTIDDLVSDTYSKADDITKLSFYKGLVYDMGVSKEDAIKQTAEQMQNYHTVGKAWDVASKIPAFGDKFIKFKADSMRILYNTLKNRPIYYLMNAALMQGLYKAFSRMSGESEEEKEARANRPNIPKSFLFDTGWLINGTEYNVARYLAPYSVYDKGYNGNTLSEISDWGPIHVQYLKKGEGIAGTGYGLQSPDPLLGPIVQYLTDRAQNGMKISDPRASRFVPETLTPQQKQFNQAMYLTRSYGAPYAAWIQDINSAFKQEGDLYGRIRDPWTAALSIAIKNEEITPDILIKKYESYLNTMSKDVDGIANNVRAANSEKNKKIYAIEQRYTAGEITEDSKNNQIKEAEEKYSNFFNYSEASAVEIFDYAKTPQEILDKLKKLK